MPEVSPADHRNQLVRATRAKDCQVNPEKAEEQSPRPSGWQAQPSARILRETNGDDPKRGKENEPSYLPFLGAFAAEILNSSEIEFAERMMINSNNFYGC